MEELGLSVEEELIEAADFTPAKNYASRQDYLAALARAVGKLSEDDYELISNEAADWYAQAADAIAHKQEIPDFEDADETDVLEAVNGDEGELVIEEEVEQADSQPISEGELATELDTVEATESKPTKKTKSKHKNYNNKNPLKPKNPDDYAKLTGEKDRYGVVKGTKTADAVEMYERGTTAKELNEVLGGRYYNILNRLAKDGHKITKEGAVFTLIHRDDFGKKVKSA